MMRRKKNKNFDFGAFYQKYKKEVIFVLGLFMVWCLRRRLLNIGTPGGENPHVESNVEVIDGVDLKKSTLTETEAKNKAEKLFKAMNVFFGTDEDVIFEELKGLTKEDYALVHYQFGKRKYNIFLGEHNMLGTPMDLNNWLINELTTTELKQLKELNPNLSFL